MATANRSYLLLYIQYHSKYDNVPDITWQLGMHSWLANLTGPNINRSFGGPSCPVLDKITERPPACP
jgi:hypothetical protein